MYRDSFTGTPEQIREHITSLKLPGELPAPDAIRAFALAVVPRYGASRWQYSMAADNGDNQGGNRMVGFVTVSASEV